MPWVQSMPMGRIHQNGYALLLSLFLLMGISGAWLSSAAFPKSKRNPENTLALDNARTTLISYAVNYIDHYGAQGAGLGHFPCPDTDEPDKPGMQGNDPWSRDGPNPPCGNHGVATGWLPRHVNVTQGRYHFHARQHQRLRYAISSRFINNPVNRVVNPSVYGDIQFGQFDDVVAVLALPELDNPEKQTQPTWQHDQLAQNQAYAVIRTKELLTPMMRRAGSWLVEQLNIAVELRCQGKKTDNYCGYDLLIKNRCKHTDALRVFHWMAKSNDEIDCNSTLATVEDNIVLLEDVPVSKHWFVRNQWYQYVELSIDQNCANNPADSCRFVLNPVNSEQTIGVHLWPVAIEL